MNKDIQPGYIISYGKNRYMLVCKIKEYDTGCFTFYGNDISPKVTELSTFKDVDIVNTDFTMKVHQ